MPDRGQNAAQYFCLDNVQQRQAIGREQRVEGIARTFERGKSQADCGAKNHSVTHTVAGQAPSEQPECGKLDCLLDQPHPKVSERGWCLQELRFQKRSPEHTQNPADDEGTEDPLGSDDRVGVAERVSHERDGNQEAPKQDDGRDQVAVLGGEGHQHCRHPQRQAPDKDCRPGRSTPVRTALPRSRRVGVHSYCRNFIHLALLSRLQP